MEKLLDYLMQQGPAWVLLGLNMLVIARKLDALTSAVLTLPDHIKGALARVDHGNGD